MTKKNKRVSTTARKGCLLCEEDFKWENFHVNEISANEIWVVNNKKIEQEDENKSKSYSKKRYKEIDDTIWPRKYVLIHQTIKIACWVTKQGR